MGGEDSEAVGLTAAVVVTGLMAAPHGSQTRMQVGSPTDGVTIGVVMATITLVAACVLPAWRASRLDPNVVLKAE